MLLPHTHSKLCSFEILVGVDAFDDITRVCGGLANPLPLFLFCSKLSSFRCNGKGEVLNNVVEAMRTRVIANAFDNVVGQCNKLATSFEGHANSKLQSSKPFDDGGSPSKVAGTSEGSQTLKAWH
jgi:hypothetical protein